MQANKGKARGKQRRTKGKEREGKGKAKRKERERKGKAKGKKRESKGKERDRKGIAKGKPNLIKMFSEMASKQSSKLLRPISTKSLQNDSFSDPILDQVLVAIRWVGAHFRQAIR